MFVKNILKEKSFHKYIENIETIENKDYLKNKNIDVIEALILLLIVSIITELKMVIVGQVSFTLSILRPRRGRATIPI